MTPMAFLAESLDRSAHPASLRPAGSRQTPRLPPWVLPPGRCPLSRLRELVGRTRSEDGVDADLDAGAAPGDWSTAPDGDWDWDAEWAATQGTLVDLPGPRPAADDTDLDTDLDADLDG